MPVRRDMHDPDLQIGLKPPRRIHVVPAQRRFDRRQCLAPHRGNLRGDDHERTTGRQPQTPRDFPRAPAINRSPLEQRTNQQRTLRYITQQLPFLLIAVSRHHDTPDKFDEAADADLGVGRHRTRSCRTDRRQAPHASIDDNRDTHRSPDAHRTHPCREVRR